MSKTAKPAPKKAAKAPGNGGGDEKKPPKVTATATASPLSVEAPQPQPGSQPSMRVLGQYLKDLSFENPNAPQSLAPQQTQPDINIAVNVNARNLAPTDFEVEL
ncbi:MAG TPA: protein-export chaperone SecB, partial [Aestuariivirga sp.]|nr:protein-export chaperone SecB [Aestuariivirga sp.]